MCYDNETVPGLRITLAIAVLGLGLAVPGPARADNSFKLSGFFGVRTASEVSELGTPSTTSVGNSIGLGPRLRFDVFKRFAVEAELGVFPGSTRVNDVSVVVLDPRAHVVVNLPGGSGFSPMLLAGVGGPVGISANSDVIRTGIQVEGYAGGAIQYSRGGGLSFRLDVRAHGGPARDDSKVALGMEVLIGISYRAKSRKERGLPTLAKDLDSDGDGINDNVDKCINRAEDKDGFKDDDGCPDIDDDLDEVLDVADKCRRDPETYNGYKDNDGCPDTLPEDLSAVVGVLENVIFYPRSNRLHRRAKRPLRKLVKVLTKYSRVRIILIGHTDNSGDADANLVLSKNRVEEVKKRLISSGIERSRISVVARGGEQPLFDNETRMNRFKNNRVELKLYQRRKE